jgi:recombinational DNA repair ATPase RecF
MAKLEHLTVVNFRGASSRLHLDFDKSKPITVIFGENGTGKSTITDALDAMGNGSAGSLTDRSSVSARDHLPTIGKTSRDIHIELKAGGTVWNATVGRDGIPTVAAPRPKIRVLRRTPLLAMVNAQPAKRYEELKRFIDVQHVETAESSLKDAFTTAKRTFDQAVTQRNTAETQLREVWTREGSPAPGPMEWAESVASSDAAALLAKAKSLREASTAIQGAENRLAEVDTAIQAIATKQEEAVKVEKEVVQLPSADGKTVMALAGLLRTTATFLASWSHEDKCPVCEQRISVDQLKADLQARLMALAPYEAVREKRETAAKAVQSVQQASLPQMEKFFLAARPLLSLVAKADLDPIGALNLDANAYSELAKTEGFDPDLAVAQGRTLVGFLAPTKSALDAAAEGETKTAAQITSVDTLNKAYKKSVGNSESIERTQEALEKALIVVRKARIDYTQDILDAVSGECNRLYSVVHPNEKVAITKLELDPDRRASLNQKADFQGHSDVTPQAYFSESHLDTLAFCFWLALTKREFPNKDAVLVLDDVFTSVDSQHINRIAHLMVDESQHFAHVVVTTHQRLWRDFYRNPHGAGKRTQLIELQRWALSKGISSYKTKLAVAELADSLKATPFVRQVTASQAGILLESILDGLSLHYRCRVPRTADGNYTLGELLDATSSLFKKAEIHRPTLDPSGQPQNPPQFASSKPESTLGKLRDLAFIRNQVGAHFNLSGVEIPDGDVEAFADLTVQLADALSCPACGQIPGRDAGTHFECSCPSATAIRLSPLKV